MGKEKETPCYGAVIERGTVVSTDGDTCIVESAERSGIVTLEFKNRGGWQVGDHVYMFLFQDGTGEILDIGSASLTDRVTAIEQAISEPIQTDDYSEEQVRMLYPATTLYPATDIYPTNGVEVTAGFSIDILKRLFSGAHYAAEIKALTRRVEALEQAGGE